MRTSPTVEALRLAGHDVFCVRTDAPGAGDAALLDLTEPSVFDARQRFLADSNPAQRQPLERAGVILFRVHPAIPENVTPLVLRTMAIQQEWGGQTSVVMPGRILMVRSGRPEK